MLPVFLLANLLTGAINIFVDTKAVGDMTARRILVAYTAFLCSAAVLMEHCSVRLRQPRRQPS